VSKRSNHLDSPRSPTDAVSRGTTEDEILGQIYDAPLRPDSWQCFVDAFCSRLGAYMSTMALRLRKDGAMLTIFSSPTDTSLFSQRYLTEFHDANPLDYDAMESGRIYAFEDFLPDGRLEASRIYTEHLRPAGLGTVEVLAIGRANGVRAHLAWLRESSRGRLDHAERAWVDMLVPHLERALSIFGKLKLSNLANELYTDALDHLSFGAVALDRRGKILFSNRHAATLIAQCGDLSQRDGRLIFLRAGHARIVSVMALEAVGSEDAGPPERVLRLNAGDSTIAALLKPIVNYDVFGTVTPACVMVYLHHLADSVKPSPHLLADLFGIAPSEAVLAILLSEGLTLRETAARLGITENSARSYCKRIFAKMGIGRQADLVRLVLRSVAMLGRD